MTKSPKSDKHDIIFEAPKAKLPASVQALMKSAEERMKKAEETAADLLGEPLTINFAITNARVLYTMSSLGEASVAIAKSIVRAVQNYEVEQEEIPPLSVARVDIGLTKYDRCVRIDWRQKKIFTNFSPDEGEKFFGAMAIVVEDLQKGATKETPS